MAPRQFHPDIESMPDGPVVGPRRLALTQLSPDNDESPTKEDWLSALSHINVGISNLARTNIRFFQLRGVKYFEVNV